MRAVLLGFVAVAIACLVAPAHAAGPSTPPADRDPTPLTKVAPSYPAALSPEGLTGIADILFAVDAEGRVTDCRIEKATHPEFGEAAVAAARQWTFLPALANGKGVARTVSVTFVFNGSVQARLEALAGRPVFRKLSDTVVPAESLGRIPKPISNSPPLYPEEFRGTRTKGSAIVSFVIDAQGHVANPEIVSTTHPLFAMPALAAVCKFQYSPSRDDNGQPLLVGMLVKFSFDESMLEEEQRAREQVRRFPPGSVVVKRYPDDKPDPFPYPKASERPFDHLSTNSPF